MDGKQTLADDPVTDVENPSDTQTPSEGNQGQGIVQTGDTTMTYPYLALMVAAFAGMAGYVVVRRQRKEENC